MADEDGVCLGNLSLFSRQDFEPEWAKVASGAFGQVYKVRHRAWRTVYAVKCSSSAMVDPSMQGSSIHCLIEEAIKMEKIKFQYIVSIYGICDSPLGIVMEYMENGSLEALLPTHSISWQLKFRIINETALGMNFLHSMTPPLLHLDLKPGNILLDNHMHVKISDFGLSKFKEHSTRMEYIEKSALRGTLSYIPPEMFLQSTRAPGTKHDIYSFGLVIWEVLTQKKPYSGASMMTIIIKVAAGKRPALEDILEERPVECEQMIDLMQRCWNQEPMKRPAFKDISVETDMLLCLVQSPDPNYAKAPLSKKVSRHPNEQISTSSSSQSTRSSGTEELLERLKVGCGELISDDEIARRHENNFTLLHFAVVQGNVKTVNYLLARGANVNSQTVNGLTPVSLAVQKKHLSICSDLIKNGADVNLSDDEKWSPLHFAAQNGDDRATRLLLDNHANVDSQEHDGWTPLHLASQNGFENVVRVLFSRHCAPNIVESDGKSALHLATYFGHSDLVKLLINQGVDPNLKQDNGRSALHIAADKGYVRVVQTLIKMGAIVNCLDTSLYSPLHMAAVKGNKQICTKLIRHEANVELKTLQKWTPMHLAAFKGHTEIMSLLQENLASVNAKGDMNWTPLHLAVRYSEEPVVSRLLQIGADPNIAEKSAWTPLHLAVQRSSFYSTIDLLNHGADVNARNTFGWTPLHLAALNGNAAIVKTLLRAGAIGDIQDTCGCTPLQLAVRNTRHNIIRILEGTEALCSSSEGENDSAAGSFGL
ncbi:ankyrin repeat and protein kinase domain-containing protein 1 [Ambystoma mexicanum]|uniref:ankyrin repeat and protein kinase domain-containing protein 1 n=1 Tax=Ambystoma mexicanum TaxID=8296 RepID=UPI0037E92979